MPVLKFSPEWLISVGREYFHAVYSHRCMCVDCSSGNDVVDEDAMSTEEFYASLRKTAADIEMLNNFD